ncbi:MAG: methyltransferase [Fuerstiella sp.]
MTDQYVQFGCGLSAPEQWRNFDASPTLRFEQIPVLGRVYSRNRERFPDSVEFGDIVSGLPVTSGSCKGVYCSHVLEHLALEDFRVAIQNTSEMLQSGGCFRFVLPDLEDAIDRYKSDSTSDAAFGFMQDTILGKEKRNRGISAFLSEWLGNYQHLWMWDYKSIVRELRDVGFVNVRRAYFGDSEDTMFNLTEDETRWENALGVECQKPAKVALLRAA